MGVGDSKMEKTFLILPGCDDSNRGDQALIWETVSIAKDAGYRGTYCMLADADGCQQSKKKGIASVDYVLKHPSAHFGEKNNIVYSKTLKLKWAIAAILDLIKAEPLVHPVLRKILQRCYGRDVNKTLNIFAGAEAGFVKGGGFLHSYGSISDIYKIYYFLYHIRLALSYGMSVYVLPNSFGPFEGLLIKEMVKRTLSKCQVVMTRESISNSLLKKSCGLESATFSDIAFYLKEEAGFDAYGKLQESGIPINQMPCVAITMRPYRFPEYENSTEKYDNYKKCLAEFVVWLSNNGYFPVMVEHVYSRLEHECDMACIEDVQQLIKNRCKYGVFSNRELTCEQLKKIYSCFDFLVGTRFHSVIFSLSEGVPALAITYGGNKGTGIMGDLGLEDYTVPIGEITVGRLVSMFLKMVSERQRIIEKLNNERRKICCERQEIIRLLRGGYACQP